MGQYGVKLALLMLAVGKKTKKKKIRQVLCQIAVIQLKTIQQLDMTFFLPQKHISEAPFLRIWDFTVFVAAHCTASTSNP